MKKLIALLMSFIIFMVGISSTVLAEKGNPLANEDYGKIREEFRLKGAVNGHQHLAIVLQLRKPSSSSSDYREVKVYNMPHLLALKSDSDNFLQTMMLLYINAHKAVDAAKDRYNTYHGPDISMERAIADEDSRIERDSTLKRSIETLAQETGFTYQEARESYLLFIGTEAAAKAYGASKDWKIPVGVTAAVGGIGLAAIASLTPILGPLVAVRVSCAIIGLLLTGTGVTISKSYISHQALNANDIFAIQRMQNIARALKQFGDQIVGEPEAVLDSNVLITAIDIRKDKNDTLYEDKYAIWKWLNLHRRNDGAWVAFDTITDLDYAPKAKEYQSRDSRSLTTLIKVFSSLMSADVVNYNELNEYVKKPRTLERRLNAIAPQIAGANATEPQNAEDSEMHEDSEAE